MSGMFNKVFLGLVFSMALTQPVWAKGPWHAEKHNTGGWQYMTPDERVEHQRRMRSFSTYEECKAYQAEHHAQMAERALREGVVLEPHADSGCEQLRRRGNFQ